MFLLRFIYFIFMYIFLLRYFSINYSGYSVYYFIIIVVIAVNLFFIFCFDFGISAVSQML